MVNETNRNRAPMTEHDLRQFTYVKPQTDAGTGGLVAEASTLGGFPMERIYLDACDAGIAVRSHHTSRVERFYFDRDETREGELVARHYVNIDRNARVRELVIFND